MKTLTVVRTTVALLIGESDTGPTWVPCISKLSRVSFDVLRRRIPRAVPAEECTLQSDRPFPRRRLIHVPTGLPARRVSFDPPDDVSGDTATVHSEHFTGPLWGARWQCMYVHKSQGWVVTRCILIAVS